MIGRLGPVAGECGPRPPAPLRSAPVAFRAARCGEYAPTWSQRYYLAEMAQAARSGRSLALRRCYELNPDVTEARLVDAVRVLVETFESLRSRMNSTDADARMRSYAEGTLHIAVYEAPTRSPNHIDRFTEELAVSMAAEPFDARAEWPVRAAVVLNPFGPRFLILVLSHTAVDAFATPPIADLLTRLGMTGESGAADESNAASIETRGPREVAEWEQSAAGARRGARALAQAAEVYERMPAAPRPGAAAPCRELLSWTSPALDMAVAFISSRTGMTGSTVLTAAAMAVDASWSEERFAFRQLLSANRTRTGTTSAVVPLSQPVPCLVDTDGASFGQLLERTGTAMLKALRGGGYPPEQMTRLQETVARRRGVSIDCSPTLNYRPHQAFTVPSGSEPGEDLAPLMSRSRAEWVDGALRWTSTHYLSADVYASGTRFLLQVDTRLWDRAGADDWMAALERLLVEAAAGDLDHARWRSLAGRKPVETGRA